MNIKLLQSRCLKRFGHELCKLRNAGKTGLLLKVRSVPCSDFVYDDVSPTLKEKSVHSS